MPQAFGIFEGGGAKGIAHIGALKAAQERGISFIGVGGTSAGAIIAALVSVGYTADDLYNRQSESASKGVFDIDFRQFFGGEQGWARFISLKDQAEVTFENTRPWILFPRIIQFYYQNRGIISILLQNKGLYSTELFYRWLDEELARGLARYRGLDLSAISRPVKFVDTTIPLKIIATNLTERRIQIYSEQNNPHFPVAKAVAASICIPVFFQPRRDGDAWLVDGGLLSNFPAWVFDEELEEVNLNTPIIGFKLVERTAAPNLDSFYAFLKSVLTTAISGDEILETRRIDNLRLIRLQTDQSTFNFNLSPKDKENLYLSGIEDAKNCFKKDQGNPFNSDNIQPLLQMLCNGIRFDSDIHLRANVMLPVSRGRLRVNYGYNMENDTDDQLTIPITSRGAGECWRTGNLVVCNMEQVRGSSDKYIIALLRPSTNSLMSVPIPDIRHAPDDSGGYSRLLGVLNIDSDNDLLSYFTNRDVQQQALDAARLIATLLLAS